MKAGKGEEKSGPQAQLKVLKKPISDKSGQNDGGNPIDEADQPECGDRRDRCSGTFLLQLLQDERVRAPAFYITIRRMPSEIRDLIQERIFVDMECVSARRRQA